MSFRTAATAAAFTFVLAATSALGGPFRDAETELGQAYADYRTALFQTNQKDRTATDTALATFQAKWTALSVTWKSAPPPQYADDVKLTETLDAVARIANKAQVAASQGELAQSHEILEGIRDQLGALRARNSVISFSDRMNAYHEIMEHASGMPDMTPAAALEHAAVLVYLAKEIAANRPVSINSPGFDVALKALEDSVTAFQNAARSGEKATIDATRRGLRPPYSRMFLRFG
ncbi:hypothetical protein MCEMSEM23_02190 [Rhabdaerophilaceae bacterium]